MLWWLAEARATAGLALGAALSLPALGASAVLRFELPAARVTSAAMYDLEGRLVRHLWSGERLPAGVNERTVDVGDLSGEFEVTLVHHEVQAVWEGVVGNSSDSFTGPGVHRAFLAPTGLATAGERVYYAVGYNEGQRGLHAMDARAPQHDLRPFDHVDPFVGLALVATDARRVYAASTGGLSKTSFVMSFDVTSRTAAPFPAGRPLCLNPRQGGAECYEGQDYRGVIDVASDAADVPGGLAVQSGGPLLAVARAARGLVQLFDKRSGARVGELRLALARGATNSLAFAPNGDLWVLVDGGARRYKGLPSAPTLAARIDGLSSPLAIAVHPSDDDAVWLADGGQHQQLRRFDAAGRDVAALGRKGGHGLDPRVADDVLCFDVGGGRERSAIAVAVDGSVWAVDTCHDRILHWASDGRPLAQVSYLPASYAATVDPGNPQRVFANFLEFRVDDRGPLAPGRGWILVSNWLAGLPASLRDAETANRGFSGLRTVVTLNNGRSYGLVEADGRDHLVELPASGPLRVLRSLARPAAGATRKVLYENGDLGWALVGGGTQRVLRQRLAGFDAGGDPQWAAEPEVIAAVPTRPGLPWERGAFTGTLGPRFPVTSGDRVVFFDPSVTGNEGFHLGAARVGGSEWLWTASPSAPLDGHGSFQTLRADRSLRPADRGIQYGGNVALAVDRHVVYGFHGEFYTDPTNGHVGQANQFMHFYDNGLFLQQFGLPSTRATMEAEPGLSGNAFSPSLVRSSDRLYLYHNDESSHGGVHRWRIDGWQSVREMKGAGRAGRVIELR